MVSFQRKPDLSVVVVIHNMAREAPRTLYSLSAAHQRRIIAGDYEVIVVDNGSEPAFDSDVLESLTGNFRLIRIMPAPPSPAQAINRGLREARGDIIGVMIDGARIATPGMLDLARQGVRLYDQAVVATPGWYLGDTFQSVAMLRGYDQAREDSLLQAIGWPEDGYRLFGIGAMDESLTDGRFVSLKESNALFLRRRSWEALDGVDERFDAGGGGLINHDTFRRALELPNARLVILLGEATFHQLHGGVATNVSRDRQHENLLAWLKQYATIRERPFERLRPRRVTYLGVLPRRVLARLFRNAVVDLMTTARDSEGMGFLTTLQWRLIQFTRAMAILAGLILARRRPHSSASSGECL
jgi:glycosyltransferase involved in cell wall biosynthesis